MKLNFLVGDSERITAVVPKASIDYVIDVESSFFYPNKEAFFREVNQVLRDDGMFFYGVMCVRGKLQETYSMLR